MHIRLSTLALLLMSTLAIHPGCGTRSVTKVPTRRAGEKEAGVRTPPGTGVGGGVPSRGLNISPLTDPTVVARMLRETPIDVWHAIYRRNKKRGYAHLWARPTKAGEPGGYVIGNKLTFPPGGTMTTGLVVHESRFYDARPPHKLVAVHAAEHAGSASTQVTFVAKGKTLVVQQTVDGAAKPARTIAGTKETLGATIDFLVGPDVRRLRKGMKAREQRFKRTIERDTANLLEVTSVETRTINGMPRRIATILSRSEGKAKIETVTVGENGIVLRNEIAPGLYIQVEDKNQAPKNIVHYTASTGLVKVDRKLGNPMQVRKLTLIIGGDRGLSFPNLPNQKIDRRPDGRLDVQLSSGAAEAVTPRERSAALQVTTEVDHNEPSVRRTATTLVAGAATTRDKVDRIVRWVYQNLSNDTAPFVNTASQVLAHKAADCGSHTLLAIALARASGIPARQVRGLVYRGDKLRAFGPHAWAEVEINKRWVPIDACWGETIADATHLRIGAGLDDEGSVSFENLTISASK